MRLADLVATSNDVSRTPGRLEKIRRLAALLRGCDPADVAIAILFLSGALTQGKIGVGYAAIREARDVPPAAAPALTLTDVDRAFEEAAGARGAGSAAPRSQRLRHLFGRATSDDQDFLARLLFGELRQGALDGVLLDAIASAASIPAEPTDLDELGIAKNARDEKLAQRKKEQDPKCHAEMAKLYAQHVLE